MCSGRRRQRSTSRQAELAEILENCYHTHVVHPVTKQGECPAESHRQALPEPDVNLSIHPAPIVQPVTPAPNGQTDQVGGRGHATTIAHIEGPLRDRGASARTETVSVFSRLILLRASIARAQRIISLHPLHRARSASKKDDWLLPLCSFLLYQDVKTLLQYRQPILFSFAESTATSGLRSRSGYFGGVGCYGDEGEGNPPQPWRRRVVASENFAGYPTASGLRSRSGYFGEVGCCWERHA